MLGTMKDLFPMNIICQIVLSVTTHSCLRLTIANTLFTGLAAMDDKSTRAAAYANTNFAVQILHLTSAGIPPFVVFAPVCDQSHPDSSLKFCMHKVLLI
jgi:hypothetical protein